jgi:hypothetical protein
VKSSKFTTWLGRFPMKFVTSSKVKNFQNPFHHILETLNKNYQNKMIFAYHDVSKIFEAPNLCTV